MLKMNRTIQLIDLCDNYIGTQGLYELSAAFRVNPILKVIFLSGIPITIVQMVEELFQSLAVHNCVEFLHLIDCHINVAKIAPICQFLRQNKSLKLLNLNDKNIKHIDENGVQMITDALQSRDVTAAPCIVQIGNMDISFNE